MELSDIVGVGCVVILLSADEAASGARERMGSPSFLALLITRLILLDEHLTHTHVHTCIHPYQGHTHTHLRAHMKCLSTYTHA